MLYKLLTGSKRSRKFQLPATDKKYGYINSTESETDWQNYLVFFLKSDQPQEWSWIIYTQGKYN